MKTLREILLKRHQSAGPALDDIRREAVAAVSNSAKAGPAWLRTVWVLWRELILPNRRTWTALASAWVVIIGIWLINLGDTPKMAVKAVPMDRETQQALQEQQQMLVQLLDTTPKEAVRAASPMGTRGDVRQAVAIC